MDRKEVLEKYITIVISNYSKDEREEALTSLLLGNWSDTNGWTALPLEIQEEFESEELLNSFGDQKYDEILRFKLRDDFKGIINEFLSQQTGIEITTGVPDDLESCPCCGFKTLEKRDDFEICMICWWEDDGTDNNVGDKYGIGPNDVADLTVARFNYLEFGIYNPERNDLKELCDNPKKFKQGRIFKLNDKNQIIEVNTNWIGERKTKT